MEVRLAVKGQKGIGEGKRGGLAPMYSMHSPEVFLQSISSFPITDLCGARSHGVNDLIRPDLTGEQSPAVQLPLVLRR